MRISIDTREPDSKMIMLEPTNLTNAIYTVHKWKICSLEFSSTLFMCPCAHACAIEEESYPPVSQV